MSEMSGRIETLPDPAALAISVYWRRPVHSNYRAQTEPLQLLERRYGRYRSASGLATSEALSPWT